MASSYLRSFRNDAAVKRDADLRTADADYNRDKLAVERGLRTAPKYSENMWSTFCWCAAGGLLLGIVLHVYILIPIAAAGGFAVHWLIHQSKVDQVNRHNAQVRQELRDLEKKYHANCASIREDCDRRIAAEENRYKTQVLSARTAYGGSVVLQPIVDWLMTSFRSKIMSADRGIYVAVIGAEIWYEVCQSNIALKRKNPHSGSLENDGQPFDLKTNGKVHYKDVPDFYERVGFAQALAKRLQFEVAKSFPADPVAPMNGAKPKITIDYDDAMMHIIYQAQNPNYRAPVSPKRGVGGI